VHHTAQGWRPFGPPQFFKRFQHFKPKGYNTSARGKTGQITCRIAGQPGVRVILRRWLGAANKANATRSAVAGMAPDYYTTTAFVLKAIVN
jgi:hypothetical protein